MGDYGQRYWGRSWGDVLRKVADDAERKNPRGRHIDIHQMDKDKRFESELVHGPKGLYVSFGDREPTEEE